MGNCLSSRHVCSDCERWRSECVCRCSDCKRRGSKCLCRCSDCERRRSKCLCRCSDCERRRSECVCSHACSNCERRRIECVCKCSDCESMRTEYFCRHACSRCKRNKSECICSQLGVGSCSCKPNAVPLPSCAFYSHRIQDLHEGLRTEEETSQDHWSVVDSKSDAEEERVGVENQKYFDEVLVKHKEWGAFFSKFEDLELGEKIGEGGQAEIFALKCSDRLVAKVFKKNVSLEDLERQWPREVMIKVSEHVSFPFINLMGGALIRDGEYKDRFAFVMKRGWGDLRTLIDRRMLNSLNDNNHGSPFGDYLEITTLISRGMMDLYSLHKAGMVHRDVKASNLLLRNVDVLGTGVLMDFECSLGVVGTGFWRAPEILEQLQRGVPSHEVVFTKEADIYSFGMLCYEIITGHIPFEGHLPNDYNIVLRGERPKLPDDLCPLLKNLVHSCWCFDPQYRPSAEGFLNKLHRQADWAK